MWAHWFGCSFTQLSFIQLLQHNSFPGVCTVVSCCLQISGNQLFQRHSALEFAGAAVPAEGLCDTRHQAHIVTAMFAFAVIVLLPCSHQLVMYTWF